MDCFAKSSLDVSASLPRSAFSRPGFKAFPGGDLLCSSRYSEWAAMEGLLTRSPTPRLTAQWDVHGQRLSAWLKIGLLIGFATSANAVEVSPERVTAKEVLRGRFTQERVLAGFSKPLVSTGTFVLVPGRGLIWQSESPFRTTVVVTDAGITQLVDGQEAMKVPASRLPGLSPLYRAMAAAISGDTAGLEKSFAVARNNDATHWSVRLVPSGVDGAW